MHTYPRMGLVQIWVIRKSKHPELGHIILLFKTIINIATSKTNLMHSLRALKGPCPENWILFFWHWEFLSNLHKMFHLKFFNICTCDAILLSQKCDNIFMASVQLFGFYGNIFNVYSLGIVQSIQNLWS